MSRSSDSSSQNHNGLLSQAGTVAVATNWDKKFIDGLATGIAEKLGYSPGADLMPIVKRLGGKIEVESWECPVDSGMLEVLPGGKFTIFLSPFTVELRDRFTIAHEIGHFFLHADAGKKPLRINREGSNRVEWEANWFAAGFLLPREEFAKEWAACCGSIPTLSAKFGVSGSVIETRRQVLREFGDEF